MTDLLDRPPSQTHLANSLIYFLVVGDLSTKKLEYEKVNSTEKKMCFNRQENIILKPFSVSGGKTHLLMFLTNTYKALFSIYLLLRKV